MNYSVPRFGAVRWNDGLCGTLSTEIDMNGLDAEYFKKNLRRIVRDADSYTPDEMATALERLADVAREQKLSVQLNSGDMLAGGPPRG